ncbi:class I SAM-dependent methyltransferase [Methylobacterium sp. WL64]|uniref:class I SAM-dependent methyltransferase n=1 Tax=Methylobacterium sp. WL64 TaxID=2603894 RepID=UPI0011C910F7|nr:class I SAM-dependent methyltransferase [Methylobacterium sp. WL64]TXN00200.1 class I SAM-dependent methyltransferase [Methylobacterium sp. WL64]
MTTQNQGDASPIKITDSIPIDAQKNAGSPTELALLREHIDSINKQHLGFIEAIGAILLEMGLGRKASPAEIDHFRWQIHSDNAHEYIASLFKNENFFLKVCESVTGNVMFVPPGHYYSPVVDVRSVKSGHRSQDITGVKFDRDKQLSNFRLLTSHLNRVEFPKTSSPNARYFYDNQFFSHADAVLLSAMIQEYRPDRIIEVGSGFSSAVILDTIDVTKRRTACTFIDPFPHRLIEILRPDDYDYVTIVEKHVQDVDLSVFEALQSNDILFLDTTHICKSGSDVNHEIFEILPRLNSGVIVHFHDIFDRFEYIDRWVFEENRSWNEIYLLRAFLMYNDAFEILFLADTLRACFPDELKMAHKAFSEDAGGGLWLRKK